MRKDEMELLAVVVILLAAIAYLVNRLVVFIHFVRRSREKENGRDSPDKEG